MWPKVTFSIAGVYVAIAAAWIVSAGFQREQSGSELLNVACDPTRELWRDVNAAFVRDYEQKQGVQPAIRQSHGGSGSQARAVVDGLDADVVTLVDVSQRPFRAVQQISVLSTPEGVAISPDGRWIVASCMAGSNLTADNPGRNEPGTGEINYPFLFRCLDRIGYRGWIGCEYRPAGVTEQGLGWLEWPGCRFE